MSLTETFPLKDILIRVVFGNTRADSRMQPRRSSICGTFSRVMWGWLIRIPRFVSNTFLRRSCHVRWSVGIVPIFTPCFSGRSPRRLSCSFIHIYRTLSIGSRVGINASAGHLLLDRPLLRWYCDRVPLFRSKRRLLRSRPNTHPQTVNSIM